MDMHLPTNTKHCLCCLSSYLHPLLYPFLQGFSSSCTPVLQECKWRSFTRRSPLPPKPFAWRNTHNPHAMSLWKRGRVWGQGCGWRECGGVHGKAGSLPLQTAAAHQAGVQLRDKRIRVTQPAKCSPTDSDKCKTASGAQVAEHRLSIIGSFWCPWTSASMAITCSA